MHVQVICVNYADVPFRGAGTATTAANLRRARDPEVKRLCGGDVRDPMARRGAACAVCLRGAWTRSPRHGYRWHHRLTRCCRSLRYSERGGRGRPWLVCTVRGAVGRIRNGPGTVLTAVPPCAARALAASVRSLASAA